MQLTLKHFARHTNDEPGDHMVAEIQQMGDDTSAADTTDIIVETAPQGGDIRICDGDQVLKVMLGEDFSIQRVLQNDVPIGEQTRSTSPP